MFGKSKTPKPLNEQADGWSILQGQNNGNPMFVRVQNAYKDTAEHAKYPFQIGVAVPLQNPTPEGLPTSDESQILDKIEDALESTLSGSVLVAIITTSGMREFVFYEKDWEPEEFDAQVKNINQQFPAHRLQFMMQQDPGWSTFKSLLQS